MASHVECHQVGLNPFNCESSRLEKFKCKKCNFATPFTIAFKRHLQNIHIVKTESEQICHQAMTQRYSCRKCAFDTYFRLTCLKHLLNYCPVSNDLRFDDKNHHKSHTNSDLSKQTVSKHLPKLNLAKLKTSLTLKMKEKPSEEHLMPKSETIIEIKGFKCDHCNYRTKTKSNLKKHALRRHFEATCWFHCDKCDNKVLTKQGLELHIIRKHLAVNPFNCDGPLETYKCKKCKFATHFKISFKQHLENIHIVKTELQIIGQQTMTQRYFCRKCAFDTYFRLTWLKHILRTCPLSNDLRSKLNKNDNKSNSDLSKHIETKHLPKLNLAKLKTSLTLKIKEKQLDHSIRKNETNIQIKWFKCDQCTYYGKTDYNLLRHKKRHLRNNAHEWFQCDKCIFTTKHKDYLQIHCMRKHLTEDKIKCFKCDLCEYRGKSTERVNIHKVRKHLENDKWFQCDKCDYKVKDKLSLEYHCLKKHTPRDETKLFQCDHCDEKLETKHHLQDHKIMYHSRDHGTGLECDKCRYQAIDKSTLMLHYRTKHLEKNYKCDVKIEHTSILRNYLQEKTTQGGKTENV